MTSEFHKYLSTAEEIIEEARQGRMFILVDDEDRENEGDLVIPASCATPEAVNFMAKHGRGLICLTMDRPNIERLRLPLMAQQNASRHQTAFTVSIEAREGVTTGISAADRARTIAVAIDPASGPQDLATPGHIFPLLARDGGVLVRAGHTEASVDIARLSGHSSSAVICEIMNDDGSMARLPDLVQFAQFHGLKVGTIADLIAYRRRTETIVEQVLAGTLDSRFGGRFQSYVYINKIQYAEHIALVRGDISGDEPVLVRMHAQSVLDDVLGDRNSGRDADLHASMELIAKEGRGVVVLLREPNPNGLSTVLKARLEGQSSSAPELRDYGIGAQILLDLGVRKMVLLSNRKKPIIGLEGYGLTVVGHRAINPGAADPGDD
ncbi:3,4-dihydroxy-2-butanone-4-phosphate synthase [Azospirillum lipoferum]|uniref:3,4-dihydroxy-2-butanone 4-phosphate synthase n=1 Tax=Azospirillum lipoferum (strain 4B) TaxID=862719 RepID=G7Z5J3_AZOL4|nr:3,4-dihydroxy-2-butanone-4-phosphate synthase [Azospirillum lipoferum]CBS86214.1 Bifunctional: GTP cyclohydrolase II/3, 4-dihydroxy-2-butanone-4-phosphate synthase [Azospirillum lipoferum 4B]